MPTSNVVPGDPAELHAFATELTRFSQALESTGSALRAVDTQSGWNGPAADAFRDSFGRFTPHWFTAADAFRDAGAAVGRYADVLAWAQRQAGTAEEQLTQAAAVSRQAADLHDRSTAAGATPIPFVDPGAPARQVATAMLHDAQDQLDRAGAEAADAVRAATAAAPAKPFWERVGDGVAAAAGEVGAVLAAAGQAALDSPAAVVAAAGGAAAVIVGSAGVVGGGGISLTGVGAVVGVPAAVASGALVAGGAATIGAATMEMARKARDNYERPSGYRKGVRDTVFGRAKGTDGKVRDPGTGKEIKPSEKWDMGHKPGHEFRKHQQNARDRGISRKEFLDEHNNPDIYRPETPGTNRSGRFEDQTDTFLGGDRPMSSPTPDNKTVAKTAAAAFGGNPKVHKYGNGKDGYYLSVLTSEDCPNDGLISFCTIGLSDLAVPGVLDPPLGVELVATSNDPKFAGVLTTAGYHMTHDHWTAEPDNLFADIVADEFGEVTTPHLFLVTPYLWSGLGSIELTTKTVAFVMGIPITEAERRLFKERGADALSDALEAGDPDIIDLQRESVA